MQRIVTILDTALTVNYNDRPISTQKDLDAYKFEFDDSWLGYTKTAVFYTDPMMVRHVVLLEDNIATIPWEVLVDKPQVLYIGVFGAKDTKIKPTTFGAVRLREGSYIDGVAPLPPTPDVYQQIISAWEGAKADEEVRVVNENSRRNNFDALVIEYNGLKAALQKEITDGTASVDVLELLEVEYAAKALALETTYAPRLGSVESQLAETQTKADAMASGSPKGVYATLVALQTAFPAGTTGAHLVTADGKWYYWSSTAWTVGGTYQSTGIADNSQDLKILTANRLKRKNLFDKNSPDFLLNKGISGTTSSIVSSVHSFVSNYIFVPAGQSLIATIDGKSLFDDITLANYANNKFAVYNDSKVWVSTVNTKNMHGFTAVTDVYIRITCLLNVNEVLIYTSGQEYLLSDVSIFQKNSKIVDLGIFMGQSNMAGRGESINAPIVPRGQAYDFRAISNPTSLYHLYEPFGYYENSAVLNAINDSSSKVGSMVSALAIATYKVTNVPLVCVSASQGSTGIEMWQPGTPKLVDAIGRLNTAKTWLINNGYTIRRTFMVWCQGEADYLMDVETYKTFLNLTVAEMVANGIEKCFVVRIGEHNSGDGTNYNAIIQAQTDMCKTNANMVLVGTKFAEMRLLGLMKDTSHFYQTGYNIQGEQAGTNIAYHLNLQKEPMIYDSKYINLYYSNKL